VWFILHPSAFILSLEFFTAFSFDIPRRPSFNPSFMESRYVSFILPTAIECPTPGGASS
jgi:hypothetical protein